MAKRMGGSTGGETTLVSVEWQVCLCVTALDDSQVSSVERERYDQQTVAIYKKI